MHMLYNSESFTVLRFDAQPAPAPDVATNAAAGTAQALQRGGFEIMDKSARKGIYIEGAVADSFQRGVQALVEQGPDPEALDAYLAGYTALAQQPLVLH
jgi:hypothetical protein